MIMISKVCEVKGREAFAAPKFSCLKNVSHKHDNYGIFFCFLLFDLIVFLFFESGFFPSPAFESS